MNKIIKRRFVQMIIIALVLSNFGGVQTLADTVAPIVKGVTVDKKEVGPGDSVKVIVEAEDLDSGIYSVEVIFRGPDGFITKRAGAILNQGTGKYEAILTIGSNDQTGLWKLSQINVWDKAYNSSYIQRDRLPNPENGDFTVVNNNYDITPPSVQSVKVNKQMVGEGETITFSVEATDTQTGIRTVSVFFSNGNYAIGGPADFNPESGRYELVIEIKSPSSMPLGTWNFSSVSVEDRNQNRAEYYTIPYSDSFVIVKDRVPPADVTVDEVNDQSTEVSGSAEVGSTITVKIGENFYTGTADGTGSFKVAIPKLTAGTTISVTATDSSGNISSNTSVTVTDITLPSAPLVYEVTNASTNITGKAEANAEIWIDLGSARYITGQADINGDFSLSFPSWARIAGNELRVVTKDEAGNMSEVISVTIKDKIPPIVPVVNEVTDRDTELSGTAEAGSTITVRIGTNHYTGTAGETGAYSIIIPQQNASAEITVTATDDAGNVSESTSVTVKDVTAPITPTINEVSDQSIEVSGTVEAGSTITVTIGANSYTGIADETGSYKVTIPKLLVGTTISVSATDSAGNSSSSASITVIDRTAPTVPIVNEITDQSTKVSGTTEAGSVVRIIYNEEVFIGIADGNGYFDIPIISMVAGAKVSVFVIDLAGNASEKTELTIKDVTAPTQPTVKGVSNNDSVVTGMAEPGAEVKVTLLDGRVIGKDIADSNGAFSVNIPIQRSGKELVVTVSDMAGNTSDSIVVKVLDVTAPVSPKVYEVTDQSKVISGKAETGVTIKVQIGEKLYNTIADMNGNFRINVQNLAAGTIISIWSIDNEGHESSATKVTVMKTLKSK